MNDFSFLQNPLSKKWVILAPRRAKRPARNAFGKAVAGGPDIAKGIEPSCPFCPGREGEERELFRIPSSESRIGSKSSERREETPSSTFSTSTTASTFGSDWQVRVIPNKYPFAPIHEIVIHSPDHDKNFDELPLNHVELILQTYRHRYNEHAHKGQVYIFHNRGEAGGESLPHPHTQIAVVPDEVRMDIPRLDPSANANIGPQPSVILEGATRPIGSQKDSTSPSGFQNNIVSVETDHFYFFCPKTSQWPDEVWIAPKERGRLFGEITDVQIKDFAFVLQRTIQILDMRHGGEFPFNFYIYPGGDWYLRLLPRIKSLGGFEVGTGIYINTQDPAETIVFIQEHFHTPDEEKIKREHIAKYSRGV